jgi:hypothetical protein
MYSFSNFIQHQVDIYKASMPTRPRMPAKLAPKMVVGTTTPPAEEDDGTGAAFEGDEAPVDVPVLDEDLVVEGEVELPYGPVTKTVVLPEEPVGRGTPALQLD